MYTNIDGISNKSAEFSLRVDKLKPHIIFITETKLLPSDLTSDFFKIDNYSAYRKERNRVARGFGGGVIILIKNNLVSDQIFKPEWENLEIVACMIKFGHKSVLVACLYRPPMSSHRYCDLVSETIEQLSDIQSDQYLLCGDFNYRKIKWKDHIVCTDSDTDNVSDEKRFYDAVQNSFLHQHVDQFTRQRGLNNPSLLDLVLTKNHLEVELIDYLAGFGRSDHCVLVFDFTLEGEVASDEPAIPKPRVHKADFPNITQLFISSWHDSSYPIDPQTKWDILHNLYTEASLQFIPVGLGGATPKNKWMTRKALHAIDLKEKKWKIYRGNRIPETLDIYNQARNDAVAAVREAKYRFEKSIAEEVQQGDTSSFYAYLRSQTTIKEEVSRVTWPDGSLTTTNFDTANAINQSFQRVFVKEGDGPVPRLDFQFTGVPLIDVDFTIQNVYDILTHLKESSAPGPCNIHPKILKECANGFFEVG